MNLKKIFLYVLLAAILILVPSACAPKQILLVDNNLNQVMHQIAETPSGIEGGSYHLFCYEDLNLRYWWTSGNKTINEKNTSYTSSLSYVPRTSKVTVDVTAIKDTHIIFDYGIEFDKGLNDWSRDLLLLAKAEGYEDGVTKLLGSIDLNQILSGVDQEAPVLLGQYQCRYTD
jgi:hypothetical protein